MMRGGLRCHWTKVQGAISRGRHGAPGGTAVVLSREENGLRNILYLHGFASSPRGRKARALRETLAPEGFRLVAPDLNIPSFERLDFKAMTQIALWEVRKRLPAVVVGSSLGAVLALEVARIALDAPLVLVAPAIDFGSRWTEKLPAQDPLTFFHHGEGRELPIHRRFFEDLASRDRDREPPTVPVRLVMGRRDESVPFEHVLGVWRRWEETGQLRAGSRFVEIPEGDHGLAEHTGEIAEEIRAAASLRGSV